MSNERPVWMPKKWTNRNQVMATRVFDALRNLNMAIVDLSEHEAKTVMAAIDQHYVHICADEDVPPVGLAKAFDTLCDADLLMGGPRLALHSQHSVEIENERDLDTIVRKRLGLTRG